MKAEIWPGFTHADFRKLKPYVLELMRALSLRDWTIHLQHFPEDSDDALASISCTYGRKSATLHLCRQWQDLPPEERRHVLVHELIHCHLDAVELPVREGNGLDTVMGKPAHTILFNAVHGAIEVATDAIAEALAPLLPLPPAAG